MCSFDARSGELNRAILENVYEQAWKNHRWLLAAASQYGQFEHPVYDS